MDRVDDVTTGTSQRDIHHVERDYLEIQQAQNVYLRDRLSTDQESPPMMLPPAAEHFTDRKAELADLVQELQPGRVVTLCGPGGIGKSALAAQAVRILQANGELSARFPDGVIWHDFYRERLADQALEKIARAFGKEPSPSAAAAAQLALSGKRVLLLLDGTENADDLAKVRDIRGACGVLVTSRKHRDALTECQDLDRLPLPEAVALLRAWAANQATDDAAVQAICEFVDGLPLAIRLVGRYLHQTGDSAADYLAWLREAPFEALDDSDTEPHRQESVPRLVQRSLEQVSETAQQVLSVAGTLAFAPFTSKVLTDTLHLSSGNVRRALRQLTDYGLLLRTGETYLVSHALIHAYTRTHYPLSEELTERLAAHYQHLLEEQSLREAAGFIILAQEQPHIMATFDACQIHAHQQAVLALLWSAERYFRYQGYWHDLQTAATLGLAAAQQLHDQNQQANCIKALGDVHHMQDEYDDARARYAEARPIYAQIGDRLGEANCIQALGDVHHMQDEYDDARARYAEARPIYAQIGDRLGEANCIQALGDVHLRQAEYDDARARYAEARPIYAQIGDRLGEANCIRALGDVHLRQAEYGDARAHYAEARPIYAQIGARLGEANCIQALGDVHHMQAEYDDARARYAEARPIYAQIGARLGEANCIRALGDVHHMQAEYDDARARYAEARPIYAQIGDRLGEANCIQALGDVHRMQAEYDDARARYAEARPIYAQIGDRLGEANCIKALGDVHRMQAEYDDARARYAEARPIYAQIGDRLGEANCIQALGDVHRMQAEYDDARARYAEARPIYAQIGARLGEANCIQALGDVHRMQAEYDDARARYAEARPIYAQIGARLGEANCIQALGDVHRMQAEYDDARARYAEARPIYAQIGARLGEANCIQALGQLALQQQDWQQAERLFNEGLQWYQTIQSPYDIGWSQYFLGQVMQSQDRDTEAEEHYQTALTIFEHIKLAREIEMVNNALHRLKA